MPGTYTKGKFDIAGFAVGLVEKKKILNNKIKILQMVFTKIIVVRSHNQPEMQVAEPHRNLWTQGKGKDKDVGTNTCLMHVFHYMSTIVQHGDPRPLIDHEANTTKRHMMYEILMSPIPEPEI